jgi:Fe-S cluster assembly protein SufD
MVRAQRQIRAATALAPSLPWLGEGEGAWVADLRRAARERLAREGMPRPKAETWRHTNLNTLLKLEPTPERPNSAPVLDRAPTLLAREAVAARLVFVNGRLNAALSSFAGLPEGAALGTLTEALAKPAPIAALDHEDATRPFLDLNTAMMSDGFVLRLAPGVVVEKPIECVHVAIADGETKAHHLRHLIALGEGSAASLVEHRVDLGGGARLVNEACEIDLGPRARLSFHRLAETAPDCHRIHQTFARLGEGARLDGFIVLLGGGLSREEMIAELDGEAADCRLGGIYLLRERQQGDIITEVTHGAEKTTSAQVFKGVLDDRAKAVFQGRVTVAPGAQGADGRQLNKTLLLSDRAEIDTKPELEIFADDVKCAHGATTGALDEDALFYLRTRGIGLEAARRILVEAFLVDALAEVEDAGLREILAARIAEFSARAQGEDAT